MYVTHKKFKKNLEINLYHFFRDEKTYLLQQGFVFLFIFLVTILTAQKYINQIVSIYLLSLCIIFSEPFYSAKKVMHIHL